MLEQNSISTSCTVPNEAGAGAEGSTNKDNELVLQLTVQLAEAINLQDRDLIAQLHETIRCIRQFDNHEYVLVFWLQLITHKSGVPVVLIFLIFQSCPEIVLKSEVILKF